jgi:hypothetical protein
MIIVRLTDGLGNQMFQYALGRKLAELHYTELKLDISWYQGKDEVKQKRQYSLSCFNIEENIATQIDLDFFRKKNIVHSLNSGIRKSLNLPPYKTTKNHEQFEFDPLILKSPRNTYLKGYWQTEKYFADIRQILLKDFSLKVEINPNCEPFIERINQSNSVSLHVRRGDYVQEEYTNRLHGVCSLDYYKIAINHIKKHIQEPHFFIFSDDPEWVKENLLWEDKTTFVCGNNFADYEDLYLMSLCKHNIIANSSFSWWGAWLNQNQLKIVCAPQRWFAVKSRNLQDIVPSDWLRF